MSGLFDVQAFHAALDTRRVDRGLSWSAVARQAGVSVSTIGRMAHADDVEADGMLALARWLKLAPECFLRGAVGPAPATFGAGDGPGMRRVDTRALHAALDERRVTRAMTWA